MPEKSAADDLTLYEAVFGWVGNRSPRRHSIFISGLLILLVAAAILAFGGHIAVLVLGRILQGFSAAVVWTSGLAVLTIFFGQNVLVKR